MTVKWHNSLNICTQNRDNEKGADKKYREARVAANLIKSARNDPRFAMKKQEIRGFNPIYLRSIGFL